MSLQISIFQKFGTEFSLVTADALQLLKVMRSSSWHKNVIHHELNNIMAGHALLHVSMC